METTVDDIEDLAVAGASHTAASRPVVSVSHKRKNHAVSSHEDFSQNWRTVLGPPPTMGHSRVSLSLYSALLAFSCKI